MIPARLFALSLAALLLALAGCGSGPKTVTKAQYQGQLARPARRLRSPVSRSARDHDRGVQRCCHRPAGKRSATARKPSTGVEPPENARAANKKLAKAFDDLADALEKVKEARR